MISGLPKIIPIAAAAPHTMASRRTSGVARAAKAAPTAVPAAMRGASGPRTAPATSEAIAARSALAMCAGPMSSLNPSSGLCPPWPGSLLAA